ncbi:MAG: N-acetylglucosamine-6-phosphate deacetylase [Ginsengibacter sp.]
MNIAFTNGKIFTGTSMIDNKSLLIKNGHVKGIFNPNQISEYTQIVDCANCIIAPGFIDLQIYGGGGYLFSNEPSALALAEMTESIIRSGTCKFLVTLATNSMEIFLKAIKIIKENPHPAVMGLHLEGPFINPLKKGAHLSRFIVKPEKKQVKELLKDADGVIKMMTLAPEMCDPEIIQLLQDEGVVVSAGHSNANFEEATCGFANGITATTHLFNAMSSFHHRDTGLPGAAFLSEKVYASIIADGIHVDFNTLRMSKKLMGDHLFLITDAVEENLKGDYIHLKQKDRFVLPDGTLSGSRLTLLLAVKNCVENAGILLEEALRMASLYPARIIGDANLGLIAPGMKVNLSVFDQNFDIKYTMIDDKLYT